ncbi:MAG: NADH-quinone oxidoreductase subunit C [Bacteriovoracaceae bacterium]
MHDKWASLINSKVSSANATVNNAEVGDSSISVEASTIKEVCQALKDNSFNVLQVITGTDYINDNPRIEVSYILADFINNHEVIIKTSLPRENPELDSVTSLWKSANFLERECYDMTGVKFKDHPDHRRILCPQDWEGFPLRKDYVAAKEYNGMELYPEDKLNLEDQGFGVKTSANAISNKSPMNNGRYS